MRTLRYEKDIGEYFTPHQNYDYSLSLLRCMWLDIDVI